MRLKFGTPETEHTVNTCIIVVEMLLEDETILVGELADSVQEVLELEPEQIEPAPRMGSGVDPDFIRGMGKSNEEFIMILDMDKGLVRIVPELRAMVRFARLNLVDEDFGLGETKHVIFCRNVIICFDSSTQEKLLNRFCRNLSPRGYIFLGHFETLSGLDVPLERVDSTTYRKQP